MSAPSAGGTVIWSIRGRSLTQKNGCSVSLRLREQGARKTFESR